LKRVVWMPKELKDALSVKLAKRAEEIGDPGFIDKIADEHVATDSAALMEFLQKVNHPALTMPPIM
jgi:acetyl-CoA synthase